jgi:hypothetical protein
MSSNIGERVISVVVGVVLGIILMIPAKNNLGNNRVALDTCEESLPRNQYCEMIAVPLVLKDFKMNKKTQLEQLDALIASGFDIKRELIALEDTETRRIMVVIREATQGTTLSADKLAEAYRKEAYRIAGDS